MSKSRAGRRSWPREQGTGRGPPARDGRLAGRGRAERCCIRPRLARLHRLDQLPTALTLPGSVRLGGLADQSGAGLAMSQSRREPCVRRFPRAGGPNRRHSHQPTGAEPRAPHLRHDRADVGPGRLRRLGAVGVLCRSGRGHPRSDLGTGGRSSVLRGSPRVCGARTAPHGCRMASHLDRPAADPVRGTSTAACAHGRVAGPTRGAEHHHLHPVDRVATLTGLAAVAGWRAGFRGGGGSAWPSVAAPSASSWSRCRSSSSPTDRRHGHHRTAQRAIPGVGGHPHAAGRVLPPPADVPLPEPRALGLFVPAAHSGASRGPARDFWPSPRTAARGMQEVG